MRSAFPAAEKRTSAAFLRPSQPIARRLRVGFGFFLRSAFAHF
jgi:hypothetical protein